LEKLSGGNPMKLISRNKYSYAYISEKISFQIEPDPTIPDPDIPQPGPEPQPTPEPTPPDTVPDPFPNPGPEPSPLPPNSEMNMYN
jgi:hypothetical protein